MDACLSPQSLYRARLLREVAQLAPRSVLEVGAGGGAFLRAAASLDVTLRGIDPDAESVRKLQAEGFSATIGTAEALPYADAAWDVVVFCYTAHHVGDWPAAWAEALRVCRVGVVVLDPWYDRSIPSQAVALEFDRWCKRIDRATGMVHNDCLDAGALLGRAASDPSGLAIRVEHLLVLVELGAARLRRAAHEHLAGAPEAAPWRPELEQIVRRAQVDGYSDDGAVLLVAGKRER